MDPRPPQDRPDSPVDLEQPLLFESDDSNNLNKNETENGAHSSFKFLQTSSWIGRTSSRSFRGNRLPDDANLVRLSKRAGTSNLN
jgi:hypothetical protein